MSCMLEITANNYEFVVNTSKSYKCITVMNMSYTSYTSVILLSYFIIHLSSSYIRLVVSMAMDLTFISSLGHELSFKYKNLTLFETGLCRDNMNTFICQWNIFSIYFQKFWSRCFKISINRYYIYNEWFTFKWSTTHQCASRRDRVRPKLVLIYICLCEQEIRWKTVCL